MRNFILLILLFGVRHLRGAIDVTSVKPVCFR